MPDINADCEPDIESLAAKAGVDFETAREIMLQIRGTFRGMDPKRKEN